MLRRQLILPAAAITLGLGLGLTGAGFWAAHRIVSEASEFLVRDHVGDARRTLDEMISRRNRVLSRVTNDIARFSIPLDDPRQVLRELHAVLINQPDIDWLLFVNLAGGDASVRRFPDGSVVVLMTDDFRAGIIHEFAASPDGQPGRLLKSEPGFDARRKDYFQKAMESHAMSWSGPNHGSAEQSFSMALSAPVLGKDGTIAGVVATGVTFASLSKEMQSLVVGKTGRVFIIDPSGRLIAASGGVLPAATSPGAREQRLFASNVSDPVVRAAARYILTHPGLLKGSSGSGFHSFAFSAPTLGTTYAAVSTFALPGEPPWTIVAAIPLSDLLGPAQRALLFSLILSAAAVALALLLQTWLAGRALRPVLTLTQAARSIAHGNWREVPAIQHNDEVGLLARSFKLMIDSLKYTQDKLRHSEENYRSIYENSTEGILRTSTDGHILSANPAFVRMLGYASEQEITTSVTDTSAQVWVDPRARDQVFVALFRDQAIHGYEAQFYRKDGQRIWIWGSSRLVRDSSGEPLYAESFISNITDRKQTEDALIHAQAELTHITRVTTLGELTASISHEVSQPLAAVSNNASAGLRWLSGETPDVSEAQDSLKCIICDSRRANEVIHRIRAMARRSSPSREQLNINDVISETVGLIRSEARRIVASLGMQLDKNAPPVIGDRVQLQQVILNLLMNALEAVSEIHSGPREVIISSAIDESGNALVTVRDSGRGLDLEHLSQLFDAFYTTKEAGLGMGLCISRNIVESHGGRLWATANVPRGAAFQFTIPVADPQ